MEEPTEKESMMQMIRDLQNEIETTRKNQIGFDIKRRRDVKCYACGEMGHILRYCQKGKNKELSNYISSNTEKKDSTFLENQDSRCLKD